MPPAIAAAGIGLGGTLLATRAQERASRRGRELSGAEAARQSAFQRERFDLGLGLLEGGPGPGFEERLQAGVTGLQSSLAPFGLTDSSVSRDLSTDLTGRLLQEDFRNRLAVASPLLGGGGTNQAALLASQQAGFSPSAGLFGDIGKFGTTLAFSGELPGSFGGLFGGGGGGGGNVPAQLPGGGFGGFSQQQRL